jgi:hypothetical protein
VTTIGFLSRKVPGNNDGDGNFSFLGRHELNVTMSVLQVPTTGTVAIGQIHGSAIGTTAISGSCSIVSEFQWEPAPDSNGALFVLVNHMRGPAPSGSTTCPSVTITLAGTYALGETFSFSLRAVGSVVDAWSSKGGWSAAQDYGWWATSGASTYWMYLKTGDYVQDNLGSDSSVGGLVKVSAIQTAHS